MFFDVADKFDTDASALMLFQELQDSKDLYLNLSPTQRLLGFSVWVESAEQSKCRCTEMERTLTAHLIFACSHFSQQIRPMLKTPL